MALSESSEVVFYCRDRLQTQTEHFQGELQKLQRSAFWLFRGSEYPAEDEQRPIFFCPRSLIAFGTWYFA